MFPFGTQYYRPPTPKLDKWEKDFKLMHECGFNIVRGWAMWSWLNPAEGKYDFSDVKYLLDLGKKYSIKVILLTNIESIPAWIVRKYPDSMYVSRTGQKSIPDSVHNTSLGGFPGLCVDRPEIKNLAVEYISKLVNEVKNHEALYGWEPHNEPLIEPARYEHEVFCYCDVTINKFRDWLKKKYNNSIDNLNKSWQRKFSAFEEVNPARKLGSFADWVDWRMFAIENLVEQDSWRIETIRSNDPGHPVMIHARSGADRRDIVCDGTDDWRLAKLCDKFGFANFPSGKTMYEHLLANDICRCAAGGKEFWMHELQSGPFGIGLQRNNPFFVILGGGGKVDVDVAARQDETGDVTPERLALWTWIPIAQGAKGMLYWQFRPEQFGTEYGFNLVQYDGKPTARLLEAAKICSFINKYEQLIKKAKPLPAKIAIGYAPINPMMTYFAEGNLNAYLASFLGVYRAISHSDYPIDIVRMDDDVVDDDFTKYSVIYLPMSVWVSKKTALKLDRFVKQGGTLVSEPSLAQYDEDFFSSDTIPGMGLDKVFGCHREDITSKSKIDITCGTKKIKSGFYEEILIPDTAQVIGKYKNGSPAVTLNKYGKGIAVYFGTNVFMNYMFTEEKSLRDIVVGFNKDVPRWAYTDKIQSTVRAMTTGKKKLVFLFNVTGKPVTTTLTICDDVAVMKGMFDDKSYKPAKKSKGKVVFSFKMKPLETKLFEI
jgi:beta-galactosidase GanA